MTSYLNHGRGANLAELEADAEEVAHGDPPATCLVVEAYETDAPDVWGDLWTVIDPPEGFDVDAEFADRGYACAETKYEAVPQVDA